MNATPSNSPLAALDDDDRPITSQLFFDDALSNEVHSQVAYASKGKHDVQNANDNIYQQTQGLTLLAPTKDGDGYAATFEIAIQTA